MAPGYQPANVRPNMMVRKSFSVSTLSPQVCTRPCGLDFRFGMVVNCRRNFKNIAKILKLVKFPLCEYNLPTTLVREKV